MATTDATDVASAVFAKELDFLLDVLAVVLLVGVVVVLLLDELFVEPRLTLIVPFILAVCLDFAPSNLVCT